MELIEMKVQDFYNNLRRLELLNRKVQLLEKKKNELKEKIKECNYNLEVRMPSMQYDKETVCESSSSESAIEKSLIRVETKIYETIMSYEEEQNDLLIEISDIESENCMVSAILEELEEEEQDILEMRFYKKYKLRKISEMVNLDNSTVKRRIDKTLVRIGSELGYH